MNERFEDRLWRLLEECDKEGIEMRDEDFATVINDFRAAKEHELSEYDQMALQIWDRAALAWMEGIYNGRKGRFYTEAQLNEICDFIVESVKYAFANDNLKGPIGKHDKTNTNTIKIKVRPNTFQSFVSTQRAVTQEEIIKAIHDILSSELKDCEDE